MPPDSLSFPRFQNISVGDSPDTLQFHRFQTFLREDAPGPHAIPTIQNISTGGCSWTPYHSLDFKIFARGMPLDPLSCPSFQNIPAGGCLQTPPAFPRFPNISAAGYLAHPHPHPHPLPFLVHVKHSLLCKIKRTWRLNSSSISFAATHFHAPTGCLIIGGRYSTELKTMLICNTNSPFEYFFCDLRFQESRYATLLLTYLIATQNCDMHVHEIQFIS